MFSFFVGFLGGAYENHGSGGWQRQDQAGVVNIDSNPGPEVHKCSDLRRVTSSLCPLYSRL